MIHSVKSGRQIQQIYKNFRFVILILKYNKKIHVVHNKFNDIIKCPIYLSVFKFIDNNYYFITCIFTLVICLKNHNIIKIIKNLNVYI